MPTGRWLSWGGGAYSGVLLGVGGPASGSWNPLHRSRWPSRRIGLVRFCHGPCFKKGVGSLKSAIAALGSATMGIYLVHMSIIAWLGRLWMPGSFGEGLALNWGPTEVLKRVPGTRWLVAI